MILIFNKNTLRFAFGNIVALTVDSVNIRATCASALPTRSRSSRGHLMSYKNIQKSSCYILSLHIGSSLLLRYAKQNHVFSHNLSFFVLVTNAERILLTKNKKMFLDF